MWLQIERLLLRRSILILLLLLLLLAGIQTAYKGWQLIGQPFAGFALNDNLTVSNTQLQHWTGYQTPLEPRSHLLTLNGQPIHHIDEWKTKSAAVPVGTPLTYTFRLRNGKEQTLTIPTMRFTLRDYVNSILTLLSLTLSQGLMALCIVFSNRNYQPVKHVLLFALVTAYAAVLYADMIYFHTLAFWNYTTCVWFGCVLLQLGYVLNRRLWPAPWYNRLTHLNVAVALLYTLVPAVAYGRFQTDWQQPGVELYYHFERTDDVWLALAFILFPFLALYSYLKAPFDSLEKRQGRLIILGSIVGFSPMVLLFFIPTLLGIKPIFSTGLAILALNVFPLCVVYAMWKHHAFGLERFLRQGTVYYGLSLVVGGAYGLFSVLLEHLLVVFLPVHHDLVLFVPALLSVALAMRLHAPIQLGIDKAFYRQRLNWQQWLRAFEAQAQDCLNQEQLYTQLMQSLHCAFSPHWLAIYATDPQGQLRYQTGMDVTVPPPSLTEQQDLAHTQDGLVWISSDPDPPLWLVLGPRRSELGYGPEEKQHIRQLLDLFFQYLGPIRLTEDMWQMQIQQQHLASRNAFLNQLAINLSHDLKSPLANCYHMVNTLKTQEQAGALSPTDLAQGLHKLTRIFGKLTQYIMMSLDRERLKHQSLQLQQEVVEVQVVCEECCLLHDEQLKQAGLGLVVDYPAKSVQFRGDRMRFEHVISNLLANALRYAHSQIAISVSCASATIVVTVADDGPGIPLEQQAHVFERYSYDHQENKRVGSGLGLWICKTYVEMMGGHIALVEQGGGACFQVQVPALVEAKPA